MALKDYIVALVMIGLFSIAIINFAISFGIDNNAKVNLDENVGIGNFNASASGNIQNFNTQTGNASESFADDAPQTGGDSIQLFSVANIWRTLVVTPLNTVQDITDLVAENVFGQKTGIILTALATLAVLILILFAWSWIRGGTA